MCAAGRATARRSIRPPHTVRRPTPSDRRGRPRCGSVPAFRHPSDPRNGPKRRRPWRGPGATSAEAIAAWVPAFTGAKETRVAAN
jgi:hypothetical protein